MLIHAFKNILAALSRVASRSGTARPGGVDKQSLKWNKIFPPPPGAFWKLVSKIEKLVLSLFLLHFLHLYTSIETLISPVACPISGLARPACHKCRRQPLLCYFPVCDITNVTRYCDSISLHKTPLRVSSSSKNNRRLAYRVFEADYWSTETALRRILVNFSPKRLFGHFSLCKEHFKRRWTPHSWEYYRFTLSV